MPDDAVTRSGHTYLQLPRTGVDAGAIVTLHNKDHTDPDTIIHGYKIQAWAGKPALGDSVDLSSSAQRKFEFDLSGEAQKVVKGNIALSNIAYVVATLKNTHVEVYDVDQIRDASKRGVPIGYQEDIAGTESMGETCSILMSVVVGDVDYDFRSASGGSVSLTSDQWKAASAALNVGGGSQVGNVISGKKVTVAYRANSKVISYIKKGSTTNAAVSSKTNAPALGAISNSEQAKDANTGPSFGSFKLKAWIDGHDTLFLEVGIAKWYHEDLISTAVGKWNANNPTVINDQYFYPDFPDIKPDYRRPGWSVPFEPLGLGIPNAPLKVAVAHSSSGFTVKASCPSPGKIRVEIQRPEGNLDRWLEAVIVWERK